LFNLIFDRIQSYCNNNQAYFFGPAHLFTVRCLNECGNVFLQANAPKKRQTSVENIRLKCR